MNPIKQRKNECSLAALCVLNMLSQADYEALSDLVAEKFGLRGYIGYLDEASAYGIRLVRNFGFAVPSGYGIWRHEPAGTDPDLSGQGIAYVSFVAPVNKESGKRHAHVLAFKDGMLIDSTTGDRVHENWQAYVTYLEGKGWVDVTLDQIFRS